MTSSKKRSPITPILGGVVFVIVIFMALSTVVLMNFQGIHSQLPTVTPLHTGTAPLTAGQQLDQIDRALHDSLTGSIAYNVPDTIKLNETATIELLLNPSLSPGALATHVVESGQVVATSIDITPRMKAVLITQDDGLIVKPLDDNPEQLVAGTDTTKWTWFVTARKSGSHKLTLAVYRLITYEGKDYWREVQSYKANIEVKVTLGQRISMLDWKWIAGILITLLIVPAFWRWIDQRSRKSKRRSSPHSTPKAGSVPVNTGHAFISYRRSDSADIVGRIYDRLVEDFGAEPIFKDVDDIPLGVDFKEFLDQKVSECTVLLAVIGDRWVNANDASGKKRLDDPNDFVRVEIESALARDIPVIPLLVRGASMPVTTDLPAGLQKLVYKNGIPIRADPDFHRDMDRLVSALESLVG
jgi:TIR domain